MCLLACAATLGLAVVSVPALDPSQPPGGNFDLSHWKLTLPDAGASDIVSAQLESGFNESSFFYTGPDGAMVFWCPVTGGVTDGAMIYMNKEGVPTGVLSIPTRYIHSPTGVFHIDDVDAATKLTIKAIEHLV